MKGNRTMQSGIRVASALALVLSTAPALAEQSKGPPPGALSGAPEEPPQEEAPPPAPATPDRVELKDGRVFEGSVLRYEEGKYVVIQLDDGRDLIFTGAVIAKVIPGSTPSAPPPGVLSGESGTDGELPPGSVKVETTTTLDTGKGTFTHEVKTNGEVERTLLDVKAAQARREIIGADGSRTTMELDGKEGEARYEHEKDCEDPDSDICKEKMGIGVGKDGLGASYQKTTVSRVKEPGNSFMVGGISGGIIALFGQVEGFGGVGTLSVRGGMGGKLPGPEGGLWNGVGYDLGVGISAITVNSTTSGMGQIGIGAGWSGLKFGKMDETTLKQGGFGWLLGARFNLALPFAEGADPSPSGGPQITLSFPKYNAGTAKMSDINVSAFVLPIGNITFAMIQAGFAFTS